MENKEIDEIFTGNELDIVDDEPNLISLKDVYDFMLTTSQEDVLRILDFGQPLSGLCSIKEASQLRGIKPPSYCQNVNHKKYKFIGKTFGYKK